MKRPFITYLLLAILVGIISAIAIGSVAVTMNGQGASEQRTGERRRVTMDMYLRIGVGMSYRHVSQIIGFPGTEVSRNHIEGVPGVMESTTTVMYEWMNQDGFGMNAMFQNDRLVQKSQYGLE